MALNLSFPKVLTWAVGQAQWARLVETNFADVAKQLALLNQGVSQVKAAATAVTKLASQAAFYVAGKPRYGFDATDFPYFQLSRYSNGVIGQATSIILYQPPSQGGSDFRFYINQTGDSDGSGLSVSISDMYARIVALEGP